MADRWIVIPNWERFQHYSARRPIWVKNYTELMSDDAYLGLTLHQRGVLHGLWLEYAASRREIRDDTATVSRRLGERVTRATLDSLNKAGFIEFSASKPLANRERLNREEQTKDQEPEGSSVEDQMPMPFQTPSFDEDIFAPNGWHNPEPQTAPISPGAEVGAAGRHFT